MTCRSSSTAGGWRFVNQRFCRSRASERGKPYRSGAPERYVTTPLLIMHGEVDFRCPIGQAEEMYTALKRQGKAAVLVRYPAEGHGFKQPHHVVDRWERTVAWFDHYLKRP